MGGAHTPHPAYPRGGDSGESKPSLPRSGRAPTKRSEVGGSLDPPRRSRTKHTSPTPHLRRVDPPDFGLRHFRRRRTGSRPLATPPRRLRTRTPNHPRALCRRRRGTAVQTGTPTGPACRHFRWGIPSEGRRRDVRKSNSSTGRSVIVAAAAALTLTGSGAIAAETCAWTRTPSGADFGTCSSPTGKTYCVTCQFAPRVCVRTPC